MADPQQQCSDALRLLQYSIMMGINIDESTFEINLNGRKEEGSIAILESIVEKLLVLQGTKAAAEDVRFLLSVGNKIIFLQIVCRKLTNGSYFSSIDDVWWSSQESFESYDVTLFDRTYEATQYSAKKYYNETAIGAVKSDNFVTDDVTSSRVITPRDIFGVVNRVAESAHLMLHSPTCSPLWYHFVHWVLCRMENIQTKVGKSSGRSETVSINDDRGRQYNLRPRNETKNEERLWEYFQKCIHGFKSQSVIDVNLSPARIDQTTIAKKSGNVAKSNVSTRTSTKKRKRSTQDTTAKSASVKMSKLKRDDSVASTGSRRQTGVGIKHFATNRIGLENQKTYLDSRYCLFIIPILTVHDVKEWNGSAYSALVLAGDDEENQIEVKFASKDSVKGKLDELDEEEEDHEMKNELYFDQSNREIDLQNESDYDEQKSERIASVYRRIGAYQGCVSFADENECNVARTLLETMVLCVCKSSRDTFTQEFHNSETMKTFYEGTSAAKPIYIQKEEKMAPVPKCKGWNDKYRVRKITFSDSTFVDNNPAPDPVLLLGKAASNWLKRHNMFVLPGCDADDDSSTDSCNSSNFVASFREEMAIRGWTTEMFTRSHVNDVVEVSCFPDGAIDEPLSDDDE